MLASTMSSAIPTRTASTGSMRKCLGRWAEQERTTISGGGLPSLFETSGLEVLGTVFSTDVARAGDPFHEQIRLTAPSLGPMLVQLGLTEGDAALRSSVYQQSGTAFVSLSIVSTWGRRR
jgi:hypothetical protein